MNNFLDMDGLKYVVQVLVKYLKDVSKIRVHTTDEWYSMGNFIPEAGEIIVFSDYQTQTIGDVTVNIPSMKIGNGQDDIKNLAFMTVDVSSRAQVAERLEHSLTIGEHSFDGSKDVYIPVYDGN